MTPRKPGLVHQTASAVHRTAFTEPTPACNLLVFTGKVASAMQFLQ